MTIELVKFERKAKKYGGVIELPHPEDWTLEMVSFLDQIGYEPEENGSDNEKAVKRTAFTIAKFSDRFGVWSIKGISSKDFIKSFEGSPKLKLTIWLSKTWIDYYFNEVVDPNE